MRFTIIVKSIIIPLLVIFSFLSTSSRVLADYLNSEGNGGNYRYELWSNDDNSVYYLKIWLREASSESSPYKTTQYFTSSREALIYFDCTYARKHLAECN